MGGATFSCLAWLTLQSSVFEVCDLSCLYFNMYVTDFEVRCLYFLKTSFSTLYSMLWCSFSPVKMSPIWGPWAQVALGVCIPSWAARPPGNTRRINTPSPRSSSPPPPVGRAPHSRPRWSWSLHTTHQLVLNFPMTTPSNISVSPAWKLQWMGFSSIK